MPLRRVDLIVGALRSPRLLALSLLWSFLSPVLGGDAELDTVRKKLAKNLPEISSEQIRRSDAAGLFEVQNGMAIGYVTPDGRYLVQGDLIDLKSREVITDKRRNQYRLDRIANLEDSVIEFAPSQDKVRHRIHVFVDVDCEYCRELHQEVPELNQAGVAVEYLFYPRRGEDSKGFELAELAYCSEDHSQALNQMLNGKRPTGAKLPCENPVAQHLATALELEVRGTPMIVLADGSILYGYVPAQTLIDVLDGNTPETVPQD